MSRVPFFGTCLFLFCVTAHFTLGQQSAERSAESELTFPKIKQHGGVVPLANAAHQPQAGSKVLVDFSGGAAADKLHPGLDKLAKYVNIYAGGGAESAEVKIVVVFHGEATLISLTDEAYATQFKTKRNPNLPLLNELHAAGVEFYVCGQSLIAKGSAPNEVAPMAATAVSALTAVVNLQADGFAYVPITQTTNAVAPEKIPANANDDAGKKADAEANDAQLSFQFEPGMGRGRGMGMGRGRGMGQGRDMGRGMGMGRGAAPGNQTDMATLHAMFADRENIKRRVNNLPDGAEAITESDDPAIAKLLKEHVPAMEARVTENDPLPPMTFHPIFVELIKHADDYTLTYELTPTGIKATYQSDNPYVVMLVQEHAQLVSRFIKNGMPEIHKPYEFPSKETSPAPATDHQDQRS